MVEVSEKWLPQHSSQGLSSLHLRDRKKRGPGPWERKSAVFVECSIILTLLNNVSSKSPPCNQNMDQIKSSPLILRHLLPSQVYTGSFIRGSISAVTMPPPLGTPMGNLLLGFLFPTPGHPKRDYSLPPGLTKNKLV